MIMMRENLSKQHTEGESSIETGFQSGKKRVGQLENPNVNFRKYQTYKTKS